MPSHPPQACVYLSPEPLGIGESLKAYAYVDNYPHRVVDVDGLKKRMTATITRKDGTTISRDSGARKENGGKYHPAVQASLPPSNAKTDDPSADPGGCAEPAVLSAHLEEWEENNKTPPPPKSCKPGDANWRENLRSAMQEVDSISSADSEGAAAPCPNCSQLIPRLARLAKTGPPKIGKGRDFSVPSRRESGEFSASKPSREFLKDKSNRMARTQELTPSQAAAVQGMELGMFSRRKGV